MALQIKSVMLLGGSGTLGPFIIDALLQAGSFDVSVLSRPTSKSTFPPNVKVHKSDLSRASLTDVFRGQDAVIDLIAQGSLEDRKRYIDAAVEAGVKRFIPSEFSSNMENEANVALIPPLFMTRVATRDYLKSKAASNPNFSYTVVSNGPFYEWGLNTNFLGFNAKECKAVIYDDGTQRFSSTTLSSVGKAVAGILSKPAETANKGLFIASFTPNQNEILATLEEITGKKWAVEKASTTEALQQGREKLGKGDMSGFFQLLIASTLGPENGNNYEESATLSNDLLGLPKEDLKTVTKAVLEGN